MFIEAYRFRKSVIRGIRTFAMLVQRHHCPLCLFVMPETCYSSVKLARSFLYSANVW